MSVIYHGSKLQRLNYPAGVSHLKHPGEVGRWPRWPIATWWFSVIQLQFGWSNAPITFLQVEVLTRDFMKIQDRWGNFQQTASHYRRLFALPCEGRKKPINCWVPHPRRMGSSMWHSPGSAKISRPGERLVAPKYRSPKMEVPQEPLISPKTIGFSIETAFVFHTNHDPSLWVFGKVGRCGTLFRKSVASRQGNAAACLLAIST